LRRAGWSTPLLLLALGGAPGLTGCSGIVTGAVANALSGTGGGYGTDEDPELVGAAAPFGLKTMETVLQEEPEHRGLLSALASGFVQYGYAFVQLEADRVQETDVDAALAMRLRARKLYLRARGYALRGLAVEYEDFEARLRADPKATLAEVGEEDEDLALLYWAAAAWGAAISVSKNDPDLIGDLPIVLALAQRALELDEGFGRGAIHELCVSLEASRPGGDLASARQHFERAVALSGGLKAGPFVGFAESVSVKTQDSREFHRLLGKALAIDVDASPADRLVNVLMQRKARRLEAMSEDLFLDDLRDEDVATSTTAEGAP
jgi:predicted anti-sigma-YlaC factor YlaD